MRLLVTRPRADADAFATLLRANGHDAVIAPLMEVRMPDGPPLDLARYQALVATSANGVHALARRTRQRILPVYAVGPQTAEAAHAAGFATVRSAEGDAEALVAAIASGTSPGAGPLFHAAGAETGARLRKGLQAHGFTVDIGVLYEAVAVTALPPAAVDALGGGSLDGVLLFSPRSAALFAARIGEAGLAGTCRALTAYCMSAATAAALSPLSFVRITIAGAPNQAAMLSLLPEGATFS